jgi:hypothetical protein
MKVWMSSELQADIGDDYSRLSNHVESVLVSAFCDRDYGPRVREWDFIAMIFGDIRPKWHDDEIKRYDKRDKSVEFRLKIGHDEFKYATDEVRYELIAKALLRSLDLMEDMNIPDFDLAALRKDFLSVAYRERWLQPE